MTQVAGRLRLEQLLQRHGELRLSPEDRASPWLQESDLDIDLWEEDAYLVGIVQSFLKHGSIDERAIHINRRIDLALEKKEVSPDVQKWRDYRKSVLGLAQALSDLTGLPIDYDI